MSTNTGEVDAVIYAGLHQLAELGYHRIRFVQDGHATEFYIIDSFVQNDPVWKRVAWENGKPVLPVRR